MHLKLERWKSPITTLLLVSGDEGILRALDFAEKEDRMRRLLRLHYGQYMLQDGAVPASVKESLEAYFAGNVDALADDPRQATRQHCSRCPDHAERR